MNFGELFKALLRTKAERFCLNRTRETDGEFLARCGAVPDSPEAFTYLAVRRVIAHMGRVEPEYIHAEDRWPEDLGGLSFWDSIDSLEFVMELEKELKLGELTEETGNAIWSHERFVVKGLCHHVHIVLDRMSRSGP